MSGIKGECVIRGVAVPGTWYSVSGTRRFVASKYGWNKLREVSIALGISCELQLSEGCKYRARVMDEYHHTGPHGRGMNGSKRDDRAVVPACRACHQIAEERRRKGQTK